jgi:hypothetical protein
MTTVLIQEGIFGIFERYLVSIKKIGPIDRLQDIATQSEFQLDAMTPQ